MRIRLGRYELRLATDYGPRITGLRNGNGPQVFADLDDEVVLEHEAGSYVFHGGHRLWVAPEVAEITYASDDHTCSVSRHGSGFTITAPPDRAGIVKEVVVTLNNDALDVEHRVGRLSGEGPPLAPWAITQFPLGGTAILPIVGAETSPQANRYLVFWPYAMAEDPRVRLGNDSLVIEARDGPRLKFGSGPEPGRLGYLREGVLFVKEVHLNAAREVPDLGAVGQVYVGQGFCELESVGGLTDLSAGSLAVLHERWRLIDCPDLETALRLTVHGS